MAMQGIVQPKTEKMLTNGIKLDGWGDMAVGEMNLYSKVLLECELVPIPCLNLFLLVRKEAYSNI